MICTTAFESLQINKDDTSIILSWLIRLLSQEENIDGIEPAGFS